MKIKKWICLLLSLALVLAMAPAVFVRADGVTMAGDGSADNPYQITSYAQLKEFAGLVNGGQLTLCAKLMNDITATDDTWTPIGVDMSFTFQGSFEGNGKTIYGLSNTGLSSVPYEAGLFGTIRNIGMVQNVTLVDVSIKATDYAGAVAGCSYGNITSCACTGVVEGTRGEAGGIVGLNEGYVSFCANCCTVRSLVSGGIAGSNGETIFTCYNAGPVSGNSYIGGIAGSNISGATIYECYNVGSVSGNFWTGGITAHNFIYEPDEQEQPDPYIERPNGEVYFCYWLDTSCGQGVELGEIDASCCARTLEEFKNQESFVTYGFGISANWYMGENAPLLKKLPNLCTVVFQGNNGKKDQRMFGMVKNVSTPLPANSFKNGNKTFACWSTAADGSGACYTDQQSMSPTGDVTLYAQWTSPQTYLDPTSGMEPVKTCDAPMPVLSGNTAWSDGWYAVTKDVTMTDRIRVNGHVNLILCDGATLNAPYGIKVLNNSYSSLTIWAQSSGSGAGALKAEVESYNWSGIGGDGNSTDKNGGSVTVNGGNLTITGGSGAAGIGGSSSGGGGDVVINAGTVRVKAGGTGSEAIGKGYNAGSSGSGNLTIGSKLRVGTESGGSVAYAPSARRVTACRNTKAETVVIEPCSPHSYTGDICQYCGYDRAHHLSGSGTFMSPYIIERREDWDKLASFMREGGETSGNYFKQAGSFEIGADEMLGYGANPFQGSYDGGGNTITFNVKNAPRYCAPFQNIKNATIQNLHIAGVIETANQFAAGLASAVDGECTVINCRSSVVIDSGRDGDGTHGGFLSALVDGCNVAMIGCLFDGKLLGEKTHSCGGFVGYVRGSIGLYDCVFDPEALTFSGAQSHTLFRFRNDTRQEIINCYYMDKEKHFTEQGKQAHKIMAGTYVTLDFGEPVSAYDVSGIMAYTAGIVYGGSFYAGKDDAVGFTPGYTGTVKDVEDFFTATAGELTHEGSNYTLKMPDADVTVNVGTHDWGEPKYEWADDCSTVTATRVCKYNAEHRETEKVNTTSAQTLAPTCTLPGKTTYTAAFQNQAFETQEKTLENIDPLGHNYQFTGWSWTGYTAAQAVFACTRCGDIQYADAEIKSERTEPTSEHDGKIVYTAGVTFEDKPYSDEKTEAIPALNHEYELSKWEWEGYSSAKATFTDKNGGQPITVDAPVKMVRTEPVCEIAGRIVYTATAKLGENTFTDQKTEAIPALEHIWINPNYEWAEDDGSVTAKATCRRDPTHELTETVKTNFILTKPSTFDQKGFGYYIAKFENEVFEPQTKDLVIPEVACAGGEACPSKHFTDMPPITSFAHIPIDWAVLNQVTFGTGPTVFSPDADCTRAQFVTFLWRVKGQPEPETNDNPFTDVKEGAYYYKAVLWAVEQGVTNGTSKTTFSPGAKVTRAQVVTFLWRFEGSEKPKSEENPFADVPDGAYYYDAVLWAGEKGITTGTSPTTFNPTGNCSRAQCVTFLYREFGQ